MARRQDRRRRERQLLAKLRQLEREEDARRGLGAPAVDPFGSLDFGTAPEEADAVPFVSPPFGFLSPSLPARNPVHSRDTLSGDSGLAFQTARRSDPTEPVSPVLRRPGVCARIREELNAVEAELGSRNLFLGFGTPESRSAEEQTIKALQAKQRRLLQALQEARCRR
ncbi:MAG: hypothetical protein MI824_11755 [Hyphomicrobiales bacterium]|nr:hypothetical protein [Hyphomicrobiales bacterium]